MEAADNPGHQVVVVAVSASMYKQTVLLVRKKKPNWMAGRLNFPGGRAKVGEDSLTAAIRELREETGLDVDELQRAALCPPPQLFMTRRAYGINLDFVLVRLPNYFMDQAAAPAGSDEPVHIIEVTKLVEMMFGPPQLAPLPGLLGELFTALSFQWGEKEGRVFEMTVRGE